MIQIRKTQPEDIDHLMNIFEQGKRIMRKSGNLKQWTGSYPSRDLIKKDIEAGHSYVCLDEKGDIIGTFTFIPGKDPTYARIYEGQWLDDERPYATIHRLASTEDSHGVAAACLEWCYTQHILQKHGFRYCGIIYLLNGDERLAYQKIGDER